MDLPELLVVAFDVTMELANLLLEYLKVLAWPIAVITLALLYKRPLISVLDRLRKATGWGATLELENEARELADESAQLEIKEGLVPSSTGDETALDIRGADRGLPSDRTDTAAPVIARDEPPMEGDSLTDDLRQVADSAAATPSSPGTRQFRVFTSQRSSRWNIIAAWDTLQHTANRLGHLLGLSPNHSRNISALTAHLANQGLVSTDTADLADRLYTLRSRLRYDDLPPLAIENFVDATQSMTDILEGVIDKLQRAHSRPAHNEPTSHDVQ
ncbi:hypothetical protein [Microbacterium paraoxydans]|uniref:DUF4129 domain-containing protein n=1 Tax=Microbacterium paraoxydans TaxID=199592 RepID=A0ABS5IMF3_9MICO|nr:hypothetical protein [Microbacterium paraoxydans]MBS0024120.1 hypothetical protein [Microbacterium paraoxydans]